MTSSLSSEQIHQNNGNLEQSLAELNNLFSEIREQITEQQKEMEKVLAASETKPQNHQITSNETLVSKKQGPSTLNRPRVYNGRMVAVIGYLLFAGILITGIVLSILNHKTNSLTMGLMIGGGSGIVLETVLLLVLKYKDKRKVLKS